MKKVFAFISILAVTCAALFAEVTAKKNADGSYEVTFFYGNPRASEVLLAGNFTDWQNGALPMEKGDKGFTLTKTFSSDTEKLIYKFISDGNWTTDLKAPDSCDDGFGGKNALAELAAIAGSEEGAANNRSKPKLIPKTWCHIGLGSKFNIDDYDKYEKGLQSVGIGNRTVLKLTGDFGPKMPIFVEMSMADNGSMANLYNKAGTDGKGGLDFDDGFERFVKDIFTNPVEYMNGNTGRDGSYLGTFKIGLDTSIVNWRTGWKNAGLEAHSNVNWLTTSGNWNAGYGATNSGYNIFDFQPLFERLLEGTGTTASVILGPNRTANRSGGQYGAFAIAWVDSEFGYFDVQYNGAYGEKYDEMFDDIYEMDLIFGYRKKFGDVLVKTNYLFNQWGDKKAGNNKVDYSPVSSDVGDVKTKPDSQLDNMAANINATYTKDSLKAEAGFRFRGAQASMMYVKQADSDTEITDNLGDCNKLRPWVDVSSNVVDGVKLGVNSYIEATLNKDAKTNHPYKNDDNIYTFIKPYFALDLNELCDQTIKIDGYAKIEGVSKEEDNFVRGSDDSSWILNSIGVKTVKEFDDDNVKSLSVVYGYDNAKSVNYQFHTLMFDLGLANNITLQTGCGLRVSNKDVDDADNPFGFYVGANKCLSKTYGTPVIWANASYAMNPYKGFVDGSSNYNMDDYILDAGAENFLHNAQITIGISWDI